ncbi:MAG: 50S ribosomal protein L29 [Patescibacteria group bacterium]
MTTNELRQKSKGELTALLGEKRARLGELSFLTAQRKIKNVHEPSATRRDIARILTIINESADQR